jgi:uncharacterized protein YegJ (DUF2314 family)
VSEFNNVYTVCDEHASRPDPALHGLVNYVGCYVKITFRERVPPHRNEHLWIHVTESIGNGQLTGVIDNDPVLDVGVENGSVVTFCITAIEMLMPATDEIKQ